MYDELTKVDIEKIQKELDDRCKLRQKLIRDVQTAREFGDLSENFEYKAAKQEKNRNESRIRYLRRILRTATVVSAESAPDEVGLFDHVTVYFPDDNDTQIIQLVTTKRHAAMEGRTRNEAPRGAALFGTASATASPSRSATPSATPSKSAPSKKAPTTPLSTFVPIKFKEFHLFYRLLSKLFPHWKTHVTRLFPIFPFSKGAVP